MAEANSGGGLTHFMVKNLSHHVTLYAMLNKIK